jgi:hypothetical protein
MSIYKKSDMIYDDYSWTTCEGDDPKVTGEPDSTLFSRKEGYEVLYMINKIATTVKEGTKVEKLIHEKLPSSIRKQSDVKKWLEDNM